MSADCIENWSHLSPNKGNTTCFNFCVYSHACLLVLQFVDYLRKWEKKHEAE